MAEEIISPKSAEVLQSINDETMEFVNLISEDYDVFNLILDKVRNGKLTVELKKRYLLRAIDETWVNMVEDSLPSIDKIIRNPESFIEDVEQVIPIEMVRKVTPRALQHLSQHTNLIQKIEGDNIVPTKLLNIYKEQTFLTYENKFINTLINRLFFFVNRRYEIARRDGQDEKTTSIKFDEEFKHDEVSVKVNMQIEIAQASQQEDKVERNYSYTTDLWKRVVKINNIVTEYANSEFVQLMGQAYVRPPIMKTNRILKNKDFHQCLLLWQFIEGYESAGYSMLVQEDLEDVDEEYLKELYSSLALQYMIFRNKIKNEFEYDSTLASQLTNELIMPKIIDELDTLNESEFDVPGERLSENPGKVRYNTLTSDDKFVLESLDVALDAAQIKQAQEDALKGRKPRKPRDAEVMVLNLDLILTDEQIMPTLSHKFASKVYKKQYIKDLSANEEPVETIEENKPVDFDNRITESYGNFLRFNLRKPSIMPVGELKEEETTNEEDGEDEETQES